MLSIDFTIKSDHFISNASFRRPIFYIYIFSNNKKKEFSFLGIKLRLPGCRDEEFKCYLDTHMEDFNVTNMRKVKD